MDVLHELASLASLMSKDSFLQQYPQPFLLRYLTQRELDAAEPDLASLFDDESGTKRFDSNELDHTDRFQVFHPDQRSEANILAKLSEPVHRFACYSIVKTARNAFPYGPTIGRTKNNDIVVPLPDISKFHCWLQRSGEAWHAYDARSTFGTFVDGERLSSEGDKGKLLRPGASLRLGAVSLLLVEPASLYSWLSMKEKTG